VAVEGNLDLFSAQFPASLVPRVMQLVLDSWAEFKTSQTEETQITLEFFVLLNQNQEFSRLPFLIDPEIILPTGIGTEQIGRLDLRFTHGQLRKVYFSIECKRLRVTFPSGKFESLAGEYVAEGMCRYFNGQYARGLDKGGMLAYVMDGDIANAIENIRTAVESRRTHLNMDTNSTICACSVLSHDYIKETSHNYGPKDRFKIFHIFLPMPS